MSINAPDRAEVIVIFDRVKQAFHFTSGPLQETAEGASLWFPHSKIDIFQSVEWTLQLHGIAHHCVNVEDIRHVGKSIDFRVVYSPMPQGD